MLPPRGTGSSQANLRSNVASRSSCLSMSSFTTSDRWLQPVRDREEPPMTMTSHLNTTSRRVKKPWGHEIIWAETEHYAGKILHVRAGHSLSLQYHEVKHESWLIQSGTAI